MAVIRDTTGLGALTGTPVADELYGLAGDDFLQGLAGNDLLDGGIGNDILAGSLGNDTYLGGAGNDLLINVSGRDILNGGAGIDRVSFGGPAESGPRGAVVNLTTGTGTDGFGHVDKYIGIEDAFGTKFKDTVTGNGVANLLRGAEGDDKLLGMAGNDKLFGEAGKDHLEGGAGNDTLDGGADTDNLIGGDDNDTLLGGAGDDILEGQKGVDILNGGAGLLDAADFGRETGTLAVIANLRLGTARDSYGNTDKLIGIEGVFGSNRTDILIGYTGVNGLEGGGGSDTLAGGPGADFLNGEAGTDTVDYSLEIGTRGVTVNLALDRAADTHGYLDTLTSIENATGTARNDKLTGDTGINTLLGGGGNDVIIGGGHHDTLRGQAGNDILTTSTGPVHRPTTLSGVYSVDGGDGNDTINLNDAGIPFISGGSGFDTCMTSVDVSGFGRDIEKFVGVGSLPIKIKLLRDDGGDVTGNGAGNLINGATGADFLRGGGGADTIHGHNGSDDLQGDAGDDALTGGLVFRNGNRPLPCDHWHGTGHDHRFCDWHRQAGRW